jgi:hypothetical protein
MTDSFVSRGYSETALMWHTSTCFEYPQCVQTLGQSLVTTLALLRTKAKALDGWCKVYIPSSRVMSFGTRQSSQTVLRDAT